MTHIIQKISVIEFSFTVQQFLDEWQYLNPDDEPTQEDYDDWVKTLTYESLYDNIRDDPGYYPNIQLIEDN